MGILKSLLNKSVEDTKNLANKHRNVHSDVSKLGKAIDKVCI